MHREVLVVAAGEQQFRAERDILAEQTQVVADRVAGGAELALLVVLPVLGQVALGHDPENPASVDHHRRVEQRALGHQRGADDEHGQQFLAGLQERAQGGENAVVQRLLVEQVLVGVSGDSELRKGQEPGSGLRGLRASAIVRSTLKAGSATLTVGTAAATRTKP